ncbi:cupin domain-containing protein [Rhizobium sp. KVB221]|uniref:Cupin domain-containing protein n=1 Tax=Rhizobium setariae TaxID=2801340 RepID=A0A937CRG5_9HYPH|nr:cupin domain-containing protein [Rhizobium setariae]MBL0374512.1 cupin domain-containing protein [Rhizobium setariae]
MSSSPFPDCKLIRPAVPYDGKQGFTYLEGISRQSVGANALCMMLLTIPPGGRAKPHLHEAHETAIFILSGEAEAYYGARLEHSVVTRAGDMFYIPAGIPHFAVNRSATEPCSAVIARTDPNEQESVVLLPELEGLVE